MIRLGAGLLLGGMMACHGAIAAEAPARSPRQEAAIRQALKSLRSQDVSVRRDAIRLLGREKAVEAKPALLEMFSRETPRLRWYVMAALAELGAREIIDPLIELLAADSWAAKGEGLLAPLDAGHPFGYWHGDGRSGVVHCLGKLKAKRAVPSLIRVLEEKGKGKGYLGHVIAPVLGESGDAKAVQPLKRVLQTAELAATPRNSPWYRPQQLARDKARVNALAARALLQLKDRSGQAVLLRELRSEDPYRREFAAETFARFGTKQDVPVLAGCLTDKYHGVCRWACAGLQRITGISFQTSDTRHAPEYYLSDWIRWWAKNKDRW